MPHHLRSFVLLVGLLVVPVAGRATPSPCSCLYRPVGAPACILCDGSTVSNFRGVITAAGGAVAPSTGCLSESSPNNGHTAAVIIQTPCSFGTFPPPGSGTLTFQYAFAVTPPSGSSFDGLPNLSYSVEFTGAPPPVTSDVYACVGGTFSTLPTPGTQPSAGDCTGTLVHGGAVDDVVPFAPSSSVEVYSQITVTGTVESVEPYAGLAQPSDVVATTTTVAATTTTTTLSATEICGNCIDDDGDGQVDFFDDDCCTATPLTVVKGRLSPAAPNTKLSLALGLADPGATNANPATQDVVLQLHRAGGFDYCARIPAARFANRKGKVFTFKDAAGSTSGAGGLGLVVVKRGKKATLAVKLASKHATFATPTAGAIDVAIAFDGAGTDRCARAPRSLAAKGKKGTLVVR